MRELTGVDLEQTARVYAQGLLMEVPPGSVRSLEELSRSMREDLDRHLSNKGKRRIWTAMVDDEVRGIIDFFQQGRTIRINFLCAVPPRQGTGTQLMIQLARHAVNNQVGEIHTTVSTLDTRAVKFYFERLGFKKTGIKSTDSDFYLFLAVANPRVILDRASGMLGGTL